MELTEHPSASQPGAAEAGTADRRLTGSTQVDVGAQGLSSEPEATRAAAPGPSHVGTPADQRVMAADTMHDRPRGIESTAYDGIQPNADQSGTATGNSACGSAGPDDKDAARSGDTLPAQLTTAPAAGSASSLAPAVGPRPPMRHYWGQATSCRCCSTAVARRSICDSSPHLTSSCVPTVPSLSVTWVLVCAMLHRDMFMCGPGRAVPGAQRIGGARQEADADGEAGWPARPLQPESARITQWLVKHGSMW